MSILKKAIVSWITIGYLGWGVRLSAQGETVLERIQRTGILQVAIREDAPPFGYLNTNQNLRGYCLDFFALLQKQLITNLERETVGIKLLKSNASNRFDLVSNNLVDLECGPNTIRTDVRQDISFSQEFFVSGTQFLIDAEDGDRLDLESNLAGIKLGVVKNTTTEKFILATYPQAQVDKFSGITAKSRGIQAVEQGKIDAMVSDGILLRAEAQKLGLSANQYRLIPETPLTQDRYGMIIRANDPQWQDLVNIVISSPQAIALSQAWFGELWEIRPEAEVRN